MQADEPIIPQPDGAAPVVIPSSRPPAINEPSSRLPVVVIRGEKMRRDELLSSLQAVRQPLSRIALKEQVYGTCRR